MRNFTNTPQVLGPLEQRVMDILWAQAPLTVREVGAHLSSTPSLAYTTVMTTMDRLHKKGLLDREVVGQGYVYRPALTRDEYHHRVVEAALGHLVPTAAEPVLAAFVDIACRLDPAHLDRLEQLISERRAQVPKPEDPDSKER